MPTMKALILPICLFLLSCASSNSEVKHTIVVKGVNDGNTPIYFSVKVYSLYAGPDCNSLKEYRRFGQNGKYMEFFKNTKTVIASARPTEAAVFGCVGFEISTLMKAQCSGGELEDVDASFPGGTDIEGNTTTGSDGKPKVAIILPLTTPLDTQNPHDLFFVANGINNCSSASSANFTFTETSP